MGNSIGNNKSDTFTSNEDYNNLECNEKPKLIDNRGYAYCKPSIPYGKCSMDTSCQNYDFSTGAPIATSPDSTCTNGRCKCSKGTFNHGGTCCSKNKYNKATKQWECIKKIPDNVVASNNDNDNDDNVYTNKCNVPSQRFNNIEIPGDVICRWYNSYN
jgi:hypothetical protein